VGGFVPQTDPERSFWLGEKARVWALPIPSAREKLGALWLGGCCGAAELRLGLGAGL
jgi:hypothetical protein